MMRPRPSVRWRRALIVSLLAAWDTGGLARDRGAPRDPATITAIVVHTVGGPVCRDEQVQFDAISRQPDDAAIWRRALLKAPETDAHYVIGRTGTVAPVLPIAQVANHTKGANAVSIGIELVHRGNGHEPFEPRQIAALVGLIKKLRHELPGISLDNVVGHDDLDRRTCLCNGVPFRRRQDPGANFPWDHVLAQIRLASDPPRDRSSLAVLDGEAPSAACPIF